MEGNEATPAPAGKDKINRELVDKIFDKLKDSIAAKPVEGEVAVTRKVTLASGSGVAFYVADERSESAAKVALTLLALKFAVDMAEALTDPEKLARIFAQ